MNSFTFDLCNGMQIIPEPFQGSEAWLQLRKTKITATDARVIMGTDPWKTKLQLFNEKTNDVIQAETNQYMQRGIDLEDTARQVFSEQIKIKVYPKVVIKGWQMASLDGMSDNGDVIVEIKCPGYKDHKIALEGQIPEKYYPQLQHIMYVCNVPDMFYFSFDGKSGISIKILRNEDYIEKMIEKEMIFYECMQKNLIPSENDIIYRDDEMWFDYAKNYVELQKQIKILTEQQESCRNHLIYLSKSTNSKGGGISLKKIERSGSIDYEKIEELKNIDLEKYRKPSTNSWRITIDE